MKLRYPDFAVVYTESGSHRFEKGNMSANDVALSLAAENDAMALKVKADSTPLKYVKLRFNFTEDEIRRDSIKILGDAFERGYGNLAWMGITPDRIMPWYILVSNGSDLEKEVGGRFTEGFGVKVQPSSFVTWQYDAGGITMWADIRNGGEGVILSGRELTVCEIVFGEYRDMTAFDAGVLFCKKMCPTKSHLPKHPVYGSNNWYYAYGRSSQEEIISDTKLVAERCAGLDNIPYMVIDDGWQKYGCDGPWDELRDTFHDMKALADEMRKLGVRPGIWVRYLVDSHHEVKSVPEECRMLRDANYFDPSCDEVIEYVRRVTRMLREWGYELIKHDFSSCDICGQFGFAMRQQIMRDGWHFRDRSRTTAEITLNFLRAVQEEAGEDCVIIGCNTFSHLVAGLYGLNRTGDDTSGYDWGRTRKMGVNTLAFRMIQNGSFYMTDADCVGITGSIDWSLNKQWLDVLSKSGSPLFISCKPGVLSESELNDLREGWAVNSVQTNRCRPLDWMENEYPTVWEIDGKVVRYDWYLGDGTNDFDPNRK